MLDSISFKTFWNRQFAAGGPPATWFFSQRLGGFLAYLAFRGGLSPNTITVLSLLVALAGAIGFGVFPGDFFGSLCALILLQLGYGLDCADGQLARAKSISSELGAWLDNVADLVVMSATGLGCFYFLYQTSLMNPALSLGGCWLFVLAHGIQNYTATRIRMRGEERMSTSGLMSVLRYTVTTVLDKPVTLCLLCGLRVLAPELLPLLLVVLSFGYIAHACYVGPRLLTRN